MDLTINVLGPVEATRGGTTVALGSTRQRAFLALLALDVGRTVSVDRIVDALWADSPPPSATASIRAFASNLRRELEPARAARARPAVLLTRGSGYLLDLAPTHVDASRFEMLAGQAARAARDDDPARTVALAAEALACWRGPALADVVDIPFAAGAATRLEVERQRQDLLRLGALVDLGRSADALGDLEAWVDLDATDEAIVALLMRALYDIGRPSEALDRFAALRARLDDRGLLPNPELCDLEIAILRHDVPGSGSRSATRRAVTTPGPPADLVGRADLWRMLAETAARADGPSWTVLSGEAGIGKTFVAEALAEVFDGIVMWGRGRREDDHVAFGLWAGILAWRSADEAAAPAPVEAATGGIDAVAHRVADRLRSAASVGPVLVVLDDVQWADHESLQVLGRLAAALRRTQVTFVLTVRPSPDPEAVDAALGEVLRQPGTRRVELVPFTVDETMSLATRLHVELTMAQAVTLQQTAAGNPLVLRELLWLTPDQWQSRLPQSIGELVGRRLDPLPSETTHLLRLAALAGDDVDAELLAMAMETTSMRVIELLAAATRAGVLEDPPLRFRHSALRDVVLAGLDGAGRRHGHLALADALQRAPTGRWPTAMLVHHLAEARPLSAVEQLAGAAERAGAEAARLGAFAEQARLLEVALADAGLPVETRLRLLIDAGEACVRAGRDLDAQRHVAAALDLADAMDDSLAAGRAVRVLARGGGAWYWVPFGQHPVELLSRIERALIRCSPDDPTRSLLLATLAVGESYGPDPGRPRALATQALAEAHRVGSVVELTEAIVAASWVGFGVDSPRTLLALADDLVVMGADLPPERQALALGFRLAALLRQGDVVGASAALGAGETVARAHRLPAFEATFAWARSTLLAATGRLRAARETAVIAFELQLRTQVYAADLASWISALHLADQCGDPEEASEEADLLARFDDHGYLYQCRGATTGAPIDRRALAARLRGVLDEPPEWHRVSRLALVGQIVATLELVDLVAAVDQSLAPFADELIVLGTALACAGPVRLVRARLARLDGRIDDAMDHIAAAVAQAERSGLDGWLGPLHVEASRVLRDAGDRDGAARAADAAIDIAMQVGQAGVIDAASGLTRHARQAREPIAASVSP